MSKAPTKRRWSEHEQREHPDSLTDVQELKADEYPEHFHLTGDAPVAKPEAAAAASAADAAAPPAAADEAAPSRKRKADGAAPEDAPAAKKARDVDGVIDLDSDDDGAAAAPAAAARDSDVVELD